MITLHGMSSPNVRKVAIALEEMGLEYEKRHVAVFRGVQFEENFLALNPMAKAPVILDSAGPAGDVPIFESGAILIYLAETYAPQFFPLAGPSRWNALKWLFLQVANVGPALGNHSHFRFRWEEEPYAAGRFRRMAAQVYRALERRLGEAEWLGGEAYSIADMAAYPWAWYLERQGFEPPEFPNLTSWEARIAARPAVIRADAVIREFGALDLADRAGASKQENDRFLGLHIPAPSAQVAAMTRKQRESRKNA